MKQQYAWVNQEMLFPFLDNVDRLVLLKFFVFLFRKCLFIVEVKLLKIWVPDLCVKTMCVLSGFKGSLCR